MCNKRILFVDDDADDRELLALALKDANATTEIVFAENGLKAVEYLTEVKQASQLPCLIVLDLNMPYLDGKDTYRKIKNELQLDRVPVIVFTSSANPNDKALFQQLGVEFITKPDSYSFMSSIVGHMLDVCNRA